MPEPTDVAGVQRFLGFVTYLSEIEKEMLSVILVLQRSHEYTYGRQVIVHTDHKPLELIVTIP